jgi:DNA repair protein RadC
MKTSNSIYEFPEWNLSPLPLDWRSGPEQCLTPEILIPRETLLPREKLQRDGYKALTDRDLLALILGSGIKGKNVMALSAELLELINGKNEIISMEELCKLSGLGTSKAGTIIAMLEFGRRRWGTRLRRIYNSADAYNLVRHYADSPQERFLTLSMNGAHEVVAVRVVTIGLVNRTIIHAREVFADILTDRSQAVILAHNHPSGLAEPSPGDDEVTDNLHKAADILGIHFLDHIIFTATEFYSYSEKKKIILSA